MYKVTGQRKKSPKFYRENYFETKAEAQRFAEQEVGNLKGAEKQFKDKRYKVKVSVEKVAD